MNGVFLHLVNISIAASWIVLTVVLLRFILKKAPKWVHCLLWAIVGLRLIMPFSFESAFSLIPSAETINTSAYQYRPILHTGVPLVDNSVNEYLGSHYFEGITVPANNFSNIMTVIGVIWVIGILVLLAYSILSTLRLRRKVGASILYRDNIYFCDAIDSPFILGIYKPRIYLPSGISEEHINYVIEHEKAHLKRKDHLWKPLAFALLTVYWFHPVLWLAYILLCRDIELACDEKAIKDMDNSAKKGYSEALLSFSIQRGTILACPLSFGEVGVKDRIKSVLHYKKPAFWISILAIAACIAAAVCFLTNPFDANLSLENHVWNFKVVQSPENGEITYCSEIEKEFHSNAEVMKLSVSVKNGNQIILQTSSKPGSEGTNIYYTPIKRTKDSTIYEVTYSDSKKGYATVGKTKYDNGTFEYTFILSLDEHIIYFTDSQPERAAGNL